MPLNLLRSKDIRGAVAAAVNVCVVVGMFSLTAYARQTRAITEGVYTAEQAQRGQGLYKAQCVTCHGDKLQGLVGPMLAGDAFLAAWGGRSLAQLVDKIQNTMPLQAPGTLNRQQSIDIAAYMLQASNIRAGQAPLADASLGQTSFPAARAAAPVSAGAVSLAPAANLAQYMRGITFPNANILFNVQVKDPGVEKPKSPIPFDYALWGNTVYYGWQSVDQAALALTESTPLFLLPGRRCENGRPVPIEKADYKQYTQDLINLSKELYTVAQARNAEKLAGMSEKLNDACANCHKVYRDVGTAEGGGLGTDRCKP